MRRTWLAWSATLSRTSIIPSTPQPKLDGPASREARRIIQQLHDAGFVAYLAGGCVRDALLGRDPKDYDVATNATPNAVCELFGKRQTLAFGASFGVIGVLPPRGQQDRRLPIEPTEVATFRSDGEYSDGRRPDSVHFGNAKQDALRRDFTINGLFYDPETHQVIDYVRGEQDLAAKILRTIGNPLDRFSEDKLRMLRAVRFATTLDFTVDPDTLEAIRTHADDIAVVSGERIGAEMRRILTNANAAQGLELLVQCNLDAAVLPELNRCDRARFARLIDRAAPLDFPLSLACLTLVCEQGERALQEIAARWKLSNEEVRIAGTASKNWKIIAEAHLLPWSVVQPVLIDRDVEESVRLAAAMIAAKDGDQRGLELARDALKLPATDLDPPPLISGHDLAELGIPTGPRFGRILSALREAQLNQQITTKAEAVRFAEALSAENGSGDHD